MKNNKVVFQLTEDQLKQILWNAKNYGKDPNEEKAVTAGEMRSAKSMIDDHVDDYIQELLSDMMQNYEVA